MSDPKRFLYTWSLPKGKKRFDGAAYGSSWEDALNSIHRYHPKRTNIRRASK